MAEEAEKMVVEEEEKTKEEEVKRKRKRETGDWKLSAEEKTARIETLNKEMEGLFGYYREVMNKRDWIGNEVNTNNSTNTSNNLNGTVAMLMEESELGLSDLVDQIHSNLCNNPKNVTPVAVAMVKSAVVFVGQRVMYGLPNVDADVLEDQSPSSLWCWETRDLKLMPKCVRGELKIRRTCRKKIHERITAVSAMIAAIKKPETDPNYKFDFIKASEKFTKVLREAGIRSLVDTLLQNNSAVTADKDSKLQQKLLIKQLETNKRQLEREKKRADIQLQKEKRQAEKENKRLKEEAEKDEKRREKEESEMRKQLIKQQEESEKELRRKEKEEADLKRQTAIKKQASMMERFLKRSKTDSPCPDDVTSTKATTSDLLNNQSVKTPEPVTLAMDCTLSSNDDIGIDNIRKFHLSSWRHLGHTIHSNREQHWSIRRRPKTELFKNLKLTSNRELVPDDDVSVEKLVSGWEGQSSDDVKKCRRRKQLLQFDKSHRPAFFGVWPKKSLVVGPRHPFRKEPDLDYDVDSDEEWEEEDPGESLSDSDKDEEQCLEEECSKDEEEESEDGFFVPDGYLSENEGVQVDRMETDPSVDEGRGTPNIKQELENEEFHTLLQQQKHLKDLTENALRKNQPLILVNLMHEKDTFLVAKDLTGTSKLEKTCLEALCMRYFPGGPPMEISIVEMQTDDDQDACISSSKASNSLATATTIQDWDMTIVVSAIQSCSQSITKVVESLHQKFPTVSKSQIRNKVREISEFVDNRWQVKKEVLDKAGISISPEKGGRRMQSISKYFSKRCLPPAGRYINPQ